jgi:hypothetical protein
MAPAALFRTVALSMGGVGLVALVLAPQVKKLVGGAADRRSLT